MKQFFKRLLYGLEQFLVSVWALSIFGRAGFLISEIFKQSGWMAILCFVLVILEIAIGVWLLWYLGSDIAECERLKNANEEGIIDDID